MRIQSRPVGSGVARGSVGPGRELSCHPKRPSKQNCQGTGPGSWGSQRRSPTIGLDGAGIKVKGACLAQEETFLPRAC